MQFAELDEKMRAREWFHKMNLLPGTWPIIRMDGRSFSGLTERMFSKPFDPRFHEHMVNAATEVFKDFNGIYVYTESDEISLLLPNDTDLFDREVEKMVSIAAALVGGRFSISINKPVAFDARVWLGTTAQDVIDYFRWRQADAMRCALNGWCYWTLRQKGMSAGKATRELHEKGVDEKVVLLKSLGVEFDRMPLWQRRGVGLYWERYLKDGYNPVKQETVQTERRRVRLNDELQTGKDYDVFLANLMLHREGKLA